MMLHAATPTPERSWIVNSTSELLYQLIAMRGSLFSGNEIKVLLLIKERTLRFGKLSERIPLRHFSQGVQDSSGTVVCDGTGITPRALRTILEKLTNDGWISREEKEFASGGDDAYEYSLNLEKITDALDEDSIKQAEACAVKRGIAISVCRGGLSGFVAMRPAQQIEYAKEINCTIAAILNSRGDDQIIISKDPDMHLKQPKKGRKTFPPGGGSNFLSNKRYTSLHIKDKEETIVSKSSAARPSREARLSRSEVPAQEESATQVLERIVGRSRAARAAVVSSVAQTPIAKLSKPQLQAAMDRAMEENAPKGVFPRTIFTEKAFGLFKKRAKEALVSDLRGLLAFIVGNWTDLSSRYNFGLKQAAKDGRGLNTQLMVGYPDAWTIASKLPWFMKHYASHLAGTYYRATEKASLAQQDELTREIERLKRYNQQLLQEKQNVTRLASRKLQEVRVQESSRIRRNILGSHNSPFRNDEDDSDDE